MAKEKIFIGSVKVIENNWGEFLSIGISQADRNLLDQYKNDRGYCAINIYTNPQGAKYACINPYGAVNPPAPASNPVRRPTPQKGGGQVEQKDDIKLDEIPF